VDRHKHKTSASSRVGTLRVETDDARFWKLLERASSGSDRASRASRKILMPLFTRPNDPLMASDVREIVGQTVDECIEAGTAEVVSEFALPIETRSLALLLNLPADHAEEWISWGPSVAARADGRSPAVDAYIDRQLDRARDRPGKDFFSLLTESARTGGTGTRRDLRELAALAIAIGRDLAIGILADELHRLAERRNSLAELREQPGKIRRIARDRVRALGRDAHWEGHAELVLRSVLRVLSERVDRLTVLAAGKGSGERRLLINFKPLEPGARAQR
jgi:cytochrome P450